MFLVGIFLFVFVVFVIIGLAGQKREVMFMLAVSGITLLLLGTIYIFSFIYLKHSPLYFLLILFIFIGILAIISSEIFK